MHSHLPLAATLLLLPTIATAQAQPAATIPTWRPIVDTVGTAPRITNPGYTLWRDTTTGWKMSYEREFAIQGAEPGQYDRLWQVVLLEDGGFLVGRNKPAGIDRYDANGRVLHSIGSEGMGPSQYASVGAMAITHDTLVVSDGLRGRVLLYRVDGTALSSFHAGVFGIPLPLSIDPRGRLWLRQSVGTLESERHQWIGFTMSGERTDSITPPIAVSQKFLVASSGPGADQARIHLPYQPTLGTTFLADGSLLYGVGNRWEFVVTRSGRDTVRIFARSGLKPDTIPTALADSTLDRMRQNPPPGVMLPSKTPDNFPRIFPLWNEIATDDLGYLWVSTGYWSRRNHYFSVFAPDGRYLGWVISRFESLRNASWKGDRVAVTAFDKQRLPVVRRYTLDRRGAPEAAALPPQPPPNPPRRFVWGNTDNVCALYDAVFQRVAPGSGPFVIADSNSMGTPSFAFHAWVSLARPSPDTGIVMTDSLIRAMNRANSPRADLPACVLHRAGVKPVSHAALMAPFKDRSGGWEAFATAYPKAPGFMIFSRPLWLGTTADDALLYVGRAHHWLSGHGTVYRLRRVDGTWQVVEEIELWVS